MKIPIEDLTFSVLQQNSDLTSFECTEPELNNFLKKMQKIIKKHTWLLHILYIMKGM